VPEDVMEPVPPVPDNVQRAAQRLAVMVWSSGSRLKSHLFQGLNPTSAEEYLSYAIRMNWVTVDGESARTGSVSPNPPRVDTRSRKEKRLAWGPSEGAWW
jgi:hypothetical protein